MTDDAPPDPFAESVETAEEDVCGCLMRGADLVAHLRTMLVAEDFFHEKHQIVFAAACQMMDRGEAVDRKSMAVHLKSGGYHAALGGDETIDQFLLRVASSVRTVGNVPKMAGLVKQASMYRQMSKLAATMALRSARHDEDAVAMASWFARRMSEIAQGAMNRDSVPLADIAREGFERYDAFSRGVKPSSVATGLTRLDQIIGGFMPKEMVVVGARPSVGKSALMTQCALSSGWQKIPSVLYSLEMDRASLFDRMVSSVSEVTLHRLRGIYPMDEDDAKRLAFEDSPDRLAGLPMYVIDRKDVTAHMIANSIRHHVSTKGVRIAFIDYLQYIQPDNDRESANIQIGRTCKIIKSVAEECGIPVVALAQLNRENQNRADTTPRLSDLKGSGDIEQAADVIILLDRLDDDEQAAFHRVNLIVAKNRNGPRGTVETDYDRKHVRFVERIPT